MKLFRKIFAGMFALALVIGMGTRVSAEADPTPTQPPINGAEYEYDDTYFVPAADNMEVDLVGHTFNAVQIIKADAYDAAKNPPYTGISWGAQITDKGAALLAKLQADDTLKADFEDFVTDPDEVTEEKPLFTAAAFAEAIQGYAANKLEALIKDIKSLNLTGQTITITEDMEPVKLTAGIGLYIIEDKTEVEDGDVLNPTILTAVPGQNKIVIKVDKPSQDKSTMEGETKTEVSDYNIGDFVPYTIESKVPNAEKFESYTMKFTDEMTDGLTFADTIDGVADKYKLKVTVGEDELTADQYSITPGEHGFVLELTIKEKNAAAQAFRAGSEIKIEFFAQINKNAKVGGDGNINTSKLEFNNNPDDDTQKTETPPDKVITFTYELDVNKIDGETKEALPGAQFALKATTGEHDGKYVIVDAAGKVSGWADAAPEEDAEPAADGTTSLLVADADGNFKVIGLDDGTYSLEEIKAPKGYNTIDPITLVIKATKETGEDFTDELGDDPTKALTALELDVTANGQTTTSEGDTSTGVVETTVENNSGAVLPSTGGIGTTIFYVIGGLLIAGAGIVLVARRKASE